MGGLILLNFPLAYLVLKLGFPPQSVLIVRLLINLLTYFVRIFYLRNKINLPSGKYIREVILVVTLVTMLALPLPLLVDHYIAGWSGLIATTFVALLSTGLCIYAVGLKKNEREVLNRLVMNKIKG